MSIFALKGNIIYSLDKETFAEAPGAYLVCEDGVSKGVFPVLPEAYAGIEVIDYGEKLIIPGMADLHIHAAQHAFRGMYVDEQLLDWLEKHAFPEEAKFADPAYAEKAYGIFAEDMKQGATTRACIFASAHTQATEILMRRLAEAGLSAYVGRVNMDRDAPDCLREPSAEFSARETEEWILATADRYELVKPMVTPRFVISCTNDLLERLKALVEKYALPVQSHLSENLGEIAIVSERFPQFETYGEVYDHYSMFGSVSPTVMAHCVYSSEREVELMHRRGVFLAHCPASNTNVITGIAPVRKYLTAGLKMGLASDVAGGHTASMFHAVIDTIQMSKQYWRYVDGTQQPLNFAEAFYLATVGGGEFFGKTGSFDAGYTLDALVLDDSCLKHPQALGLRERLERSVYLGLDDRGGICAKYVSGRNILA